MDRAREEFVTEPTVPRPEPGRFSFSRPAKRVADELEQSLDRYGQLRPILCLREAGMLTVVSGHRRLAYAVRKGRDEVRLCTVAVESRAALWDLLLADHLDGRQLNPVEQGLYLRRRMADTGEDRETLAATGVLGRVGLAERASAASDALWLADLPAALQEAFADGRLPGQGVRVLARGSREDALAILGLFAGARLGVNRFSELAGWILECAWREGLGAGEWLRQGGLEQFRGDPERLRGEVRARRFPTLCRWERSFRQDAAAAGLPTGARFSHAKGFEGGKLTYSAQFASLNELESRLVETLHALRAGRLAPLKTYLE